jgi:hypothetical protein
VIIPGMSLEVVMDSLRKDPSENASMTEMLNR